METKYDEDHFLSKFSSIGDNRWFIGEFYSLDGEKACALGHCGKSSVEATFLRILFEKNNLNVAIINDGYIGSGWFPTKEAEQAANNSKKYFHLSTPKQRILAALNDIKKAQEPKQEVVKEVIVYKTVEIDSKVKDLTKQELILN